MAVMEGPLSKWTNVMKGWQYRWFVLDDNAGLLSYYTSKDKMVRGARRGCVRLKGAVIGIDDEDDSTFTITVDGKIFHFQARDEEERERWVRSLEETILRHSHSGLYHKKWDELQSSSTLQDFDKKLMESDAYLQILIDQVKELELRIDNSNDEIEKSQLSNVRDKANAMLETIKHSIVLLQIAKNTTHPVNGVYHSYAGSEKAPSNRLAPPSILTKANVDSLIAAQKFVSETAITGIDCATECLEDTLGNEGTRSASVPSSLNCSKDSIPATVQEAQEKLPHVTTAPATHLTLFVPETSYSSSDDDDYFDATEDAGISLQSPNGHRVFEDAVENMCDDKLRHNPTMGSEKRIDYDAIYDDDDEEDLGSVGGQGSVISHLLSQLKIGMDLTKVVLPTFILERRSLLEMYADFFAHPNLFISIPDYSDPKDRMLQVLKWYLSAFHAGRKSSVAKKPYNPILGEIFRCYWDIPEIEISESEAKQKVSDGPVPWAHKNNLTFIAEQVSHHPPVSAFYAEHYNKGISCCAHIWTKSKFLGLSICVHNIGQGCISVLKYDEEYLINFPSGYGRSILSVPWIELCGEVNISCAKTGYYAHIDFHSKPFYNNKKHRITANVFQPSDKKPFFTVTGEWNGIMEGKCLNTGETEVFVDTRSIPIVRKRVSRVVEQEPYESRRLWKDVTAALKLCNVHHATESKFALEQKQREEAKERLTKGIKWETRVFHEIGENWVYDEPLIKRINRESSNQ